MQQTHKTHKLNVEYFIGHLMPWGAQQKIYTGFNVPAFFIYRQPRENKNAIENRKN